MATLTNARFPGNDRDSATSVGERCWGCREFVNAEIGPLAVHVVLSCYSPLLGYYFLVCLPVDDGGEGGRGYGSNPEMRPGLNKSMKLLIFFILFSVTCVASRTSRGEIQWKRMDKTLYCL